MKDVATSCIGFQGGQPQMSRRRRHACGCVRGRCLIVPCGTAFRSPGGNPLIQIGDNEIVAVDQMVWRSGSIA